MTCPEAYGAVSCKLFVGTLLLLHTYLQTFYFYYCVGKIIWYNGNVWIYVIYQRCIMDIVKKTDIKNKIIKFMNNKKIYFHVENRNCDFITQNTLTITCCSCVKTTVTFGCGPAYCRQNNQWRSNYTLKQVRFRADLCSFPSHYGKCSTCNQTVLRDTKKCVCLWMHYSNQK